MNTSSVCAYLPAMFLALAAFGCDGNGTGENINSLLPNPCDVSGDPSCSPQSSCDQLDENACVANPSCEPIFGGADCVCPMCVPGEGCPPCDCPTEGFQGCRELGPCEGLDENACIANPACDPQYSASGCACPMCLPGESCPPCDCPPPSEHYDGCYPAEPPHPCEGLDEQTCNATSGCLGIYGPQPCPLLPCASDDPTCDTMCPEEDSYLYCTLDQPMDPCANLDENRCIADPSCDPYYHGGCATVCDDQGHCATTCEPEEPCIETCSPNGDCTTVCRPSAPDTCDEHGNCVDIPPPPPQHPDYAGCHFRPSDPPACAEVACMMYCENGFRQGPDGCDICACADAPDGP